MSVMAAVAKIRWGFGSTYGAGNDDGSWGGHDIAGLTSALASGTIYPGLMG
jgi:hypothetical protein